jgi:CubicO group peptidase (beta-lactamase class C family)
LKARIGALVKGLMTVSDKYMKTPDIISQVALQGKLSLSYESLDVLGDKLNEDVEKGVIPGAVVLVGQYNNIRYFESVGYCDSRSRYEMRRDSIFCLASLTKLFTSVAVMTLVEDGKIHLCQPVSHFLPAFKDLKVSVERPGTAHGGIVQTLVPAAREMTIQDLLRHTSGLTYGEFGNSLVHQAYVNMKAFDWDQTNAEMAEKLASLPLVCHPGSTFEYGISTDVLGHIIEIVSDLPLDVFMHERLCKPLGLKDTAFYLDDTDLHRLALPLPDANGLIEPGFNLARPQNSRWISGGGGLFSTAMDVYRFMQMLANGGQLDGERILRPKTVELMTSDHLPPNVGYGQYVGALQMTAPTPEMGQGFGLGFAVRTAQGRNPLPGSLGDFYWAGVSGTYAWVDPVENLIGVLMMRAPQERVRYRALIRQMVYQALQGNV